MSVVRSAARELTLLDTLARRLRECCSTPDGVALPAAILWTDPERQWLPIIDAVRDRVPELLVLGDYDPDRRVGPAIWLRSVIDGAIELLHARGDGVPIVYLPGVGRQQLRAGEDCPRALQPLVELMYRGTLWLQKGGHDWSVTAFLSSPHGLGLELSRDQETLDALVRALPEIAETPLDQLRGGKLEAEDFDRLLSPDLFRDLLRWMGDPRAWRERIGAERWQAFGNQCRARLDFNPEAEGELEAGRRLGAGGGPWAEAWERFTEAPAAYPGIPALLRRSKPDQLFVDHSRWPDENAYAESSLADALRRIAGLPHADACNQVLELEKEHGQRRGWVWARLGEAPLAMLLDPLSRVAKHASTAIGGGTPDGMAYTYTERAWRTDASAWQAVALATPSYEKLIQDVVRALLESWTDESARAFQHAISARPLPTHADAKPIDASEGGCLMFVDGLRYDVGHVLAERLEGLGCRVRVDWRWAALPTVTGTAKPAATPVVARIIGNAMPEDFAPSLRESGRAARTVEIRREIERAGYQVLGEQQGEWPASDSARGWCEAGKIDELGHQLQDRLARQIPEEIERIVERVISLLDSGWSSVRVVTDHGWLLLPGGLPKIDLPRHLTASRWARCATIAGNSQVPVPTIPWHWNPNERFATAPGIACFNASPAYTHGGLSLQECIIPDVLVERGGVVETHATITGVTWRGMRCFVEADVSGGVVRVDVRLGGALGASAAATVKQIEDGGRVSVVVDDDRHEGAQATVVLVDEDGTVLGQRTTRIGEVT